MTTNASGGFTYAVEARASHSFRFVYPGTATILPVEDTATLLVKGTSTFTVKPKRVLNGDSVTFSGRVKGRPLPEAGKLLELQVRFTSGWQTFRTIHTRGRTALGRFPTSSIAPAASRSSTSGLILPARRAGRWRPATAGALTVRVKGRPC